MVQAARREVWVQGHPVRYQVAGAGEPVILVHGLAGSSRWWRHNVPALAERYAVYTVDLPGFGGMRRLRRRFVLAGAASWLLTWMEAIGIAPAHVVGHSMGGYVCLRLAAERPEAVRRLALAAPAGVPSGRSLAGHLIPLMVTGGYVAPRFMPVVLLDALRAGPWTLWRAGRELLREDVRPYLQRITAPTLLIWGERDHLVPPALGPALREAIPGSRLLLLRGAGHIPMVDRPGDFNAALLAFLSGEPVGA